MGSLLSRQSRQSCVGLVFTLFNPPSGVVVVKRKMGVTVDECRLICGGNCLITANLCHLL